jgi:hypothetical protein
MLHIHRVKQTQKTANVNKRQRDDRSETHLDRVRRGADSLRDTALLLVAPETSSFPNSKVLPHLGGLKCPKSKLLENLCPKSTLKHGFSFSVRNIAGHRDTAAMSNNNTLCFSSLFPVLGKHTILTVFRPRSIRNPPSLSCTWFIFPLFFGGGGGGWGWFRRRFRFII